MDVLLLHSMMIVFLIKNVYNTLYITYFPEKSRNDSHDLDMKWTFEKKRKERLEIALKRRFLFLDIISDIQHFTSPSKCTYVHVQFRSLFVINSGTSRRAVALRENLGWHDVDANFFRYYTDMLPRFISRYFSRKLPTESVESWYRIWPFQKWFSFLRPNMSSTMI